jgi:glutamate carboxypeptidase
MVAAADPPATVDLATATQLLPEILADIIELVGIESPSGDAAALAASAEAVTELVRRRLGAEPQRLGPPDAPHLRLRLGAGPRRVLLLGHHDTVWPRGTLDRLPCRLDGDVLRGPGCFDMKTGVVVAVHALALLAGYDAALVDGVTLLVTGDEEVGSPSSRALIEEEAAGCDAVLVLEAAAPDGALKCARKGVALYTLEVTGVAAHAGLDPEKGANAAVEAAHQILAVAALADPSRGTTVTPGLVRAGTTANTVADRATFFVDVRAGTPDELARVDASIRGLDPQVAGCRLQVGGGINRPPMTAEASASLLARAQAVAARLGLPPVTGVAVGGASDANFTAGIGVPSLDGLGAVGGGAHADSEHVLVNEIPPRLALVTGLLADLLG